MDRPSMAEISARLSELKIDTNLMEQKKRAQVQAAQDKEKQRARMTSRIVESVPKRKDDSILAKQDLSRVGGLRGSLNQTFSLADKKSERAESRRSSDFGREGLSKGDIEGIGLLKMGPGAGGTGTGTKQEAEDVDAEAHREHHRKHEVPTIRSTMPAGLSLIGGSSRGSSSDGDSGSGRGSWHAGTGKDRNSSYKSVRKLKADTHEDEEEAGKRALLMRTADPLTYGEMLDTGDTESGKSELKWGKVAGPREQALQRFSLGRRHTAGADSIASSVQSGRLRGSQKLDKINKSGRSARSGRVHGKRSGHMELVKSSHDDAGGQAGGGGQRGEVGVRGGDESGH